MKSNTLKLWISNLLFVIGISFPGFSDYVGLFPDSNSIRMEIIDPASMQNRFEGTPRRIPVAAVNETATQVRLVGTIAF